MFSVKEQRLITFKIKENYGKFGSDTWKTYIKAPVKDRDYLAAAAGIPAAGVRTFLEGLDPLYEGVLDRELEQTNFRTGRDIKYIATSTAGAIGSVLTLKPVQALKNVGGVALGAFRVPFQDIPLDLMDGAVGYSSYRQDTRSKVSTTLAA